MNLTNIKHEINRILPSTPLGSLFARNSTKEYLEEYFWKTELKNIINWYCGNINSLYGVNKPADDQKEYCINEVHSAVRTWTKVFQYEKYKTDLMLETGCFHGMTVLDIGSGPFSSGKVFDPAKLYCLDKLMAKYMDIGYPMHYDEGVYYIQAPSEQIPLDSQSIDAVISVNALDHVNSFEESASEIIRVLKPQGKIGLHLHFHPRTLTEPIELTENRVESAFAGISGFRKIAESNEKYGWTNTNSNEKYCVYRNY